MLLYYKITNKQIFICNFIVLATALRFAPVAQQKKSIKRLRYLIPFFCLLFFRKYTNNYLKT